MAWTNPTEPKDLDGDGQLTVSEFWEGDVAGDDEGGAFQLLDRDGNGGSAAIFFPMRTDQKYDIFRSHGAKNGSDQKKDTWAELLMLALFGPLDLQLFWIRSFECGRTDGLGIWSAPHHGRLPGAFQSCFVKFYGWAV